MDTITRRWYIKNLIGNSYLAFKWITKNFAKRQDIIVNDETDIMIEGYPRSGNTFAVAAFNFAQDKEIKIARHRHEAGHVILAAKLNKPILLIIREPVGAVISLCIRENIAIKYAFEYYIDFYRKLLPFIDKIIVVDFKSVVTDMGEVIEKINKKFNCDFKVFEHSEENVKEVKKIVEQMDQKEIEQYNLDTFEEKDNSLRVAFPNETREKTKALILEQIKSNKEYSNILENAENIYQKYVKKCL